MRITELFTAQSIALDEALQTQEQILSRLVRRRLGRSVPARAGAAGRCLRRLRRHEIPFLTSQN